MLKKLKEPNKLDMMELFFGGHLAQRLSIVPNGFIRDAENI